MRFGTRQILGLTGLLIIPAKAAFGAASEEVKLQVRDGHPILEAVYLNHHGPYKFLVDTGTNVNLIHSGLTRAIGLQPTFQTEMATSSGKTVLPGSDMVEVCIGSICAGEQKSLFSDLTAIRRRWPDIQGVVGQWFLSRFDYTLDMRARKLVFGRQEPSGSRTPFQWVNGRPAISTPLGELVLDSGADTVILMGVRADHSPMRNELRTMTGQQQIGAASRSLVIDGRRFWSGEAAVMPNRNEPGVDGLMPVNIFKSIYVCNSEGYMVFK
jgi:hypothetical protein